MDHPQIETERLLLRYPEEQDFEPLAEMMQDEEVARFIGGVQDPAITWRAFCSLLGHWQLRGYGFFSVVDKASGEWLGRIGPWYPHLWPQPEVGWTIKRAAWGKGYAPEAAAACLDFVFDTLDWPSVIHLIDQKNTPSQAVARKLGSTDSGQEVEVPGFGIKVNVWGQTADEWRANRATLR